MKRLLFLLAGFVPFLWFMSCGDSNLEGWFPYISTGQPLTINISLDKYIINVNAPACTELVTVTSDGSWTVSSDAEWCSPSVASGDKTQSISVTIQENTTTESRDCNLTFTTASGNKSILKVTQAHQPFYLDITPDSINESFSECSVTINVLSNDTWNVSKSDSWINLSKESGTNDDTFVVKLSENPGLPQRSGIVTVLGTHSNPKTISITQTGNSRLVVDPKEIRKDYHESESMTVIVKSNDSWTVSKDKEWIIVPQPVGRGDGSFEVKISLNPSTTSRDGDITITNTTSGLSDTIKVHQGGAPSSDIEINGYDSEDTNLDNSK